MLRCKVDRAGGGSERKVESERADVAKNKYSRWLGTINGFAEYNSTFGNNSESRCVAGQ